MKKSILLILIGILSSIVVNAQADCFFKYCYIGEVSLKTKMAKSDNIFVQLPSPELMLRIADKTTGLIKAKISDKLNYEKKAVTTGSSIFCGTSDYIIAMILKGSNKVYTIYIINGAKKYRKDINIKDISFYNRNGTIYIDLPQIVI